MFNGVYNDNDASCQTVLVTIQSAPKGEKNVRPILYQIVLLKGISFFLKVANFSKPNSPVSIGFWLRFKKDSTEEMHTHKMVMYKPCGRILRKKWPFLRQKIFILCKRIT